MTVFEAYHRIFGKGSALTCFVEATHINEVTHWIIMNPTLNRSSEIQSNTQWIVCLYVQYLNSIQNCHMYSLMGLRDCIFIRLTHTLPQDKLESEQSIWNLCFQARRFQIITALLQWGSTRVRIDSWLLLIVLFFLWCNVQGLYPENHGIVDNTFYDRELNDTFTIHRTDSKWWLGEPVSHYTSAPTSSSLPRPPLFLLLLLTSSSSSPLLSSSSSLSSTSSSPFPVHSRFVLMPHIYM